MPGRQSVQYRCRQAGGLGSEHQRIARLKGGVAVQPLPFGTECPQPVSWQRQPAVGESGVAPYRCIFVVIESGPAQAHIVRFEAERLDQVQCGAGVGTQSYDVAGVGRNLR